MAHCSAGGWYYHQGSAGGDEAALVLLRGAGDLQTSLYAGHHVGKDQPAFGRSAEPSFMARVEFGLRDFLCGSCLALCGSEHGSPLRPPPKLIRAEGGSHGCSKQNSWRKKKSHLHRRGLNDAAGWCSRPLVNVRGWFAATSAH